MRFALILLTALLVQSPHTKPQPPVSPNDAGKTTADHGGTQDNPLVVHIKGTEQSQQEATDNRAKADYDASIKRRELILTGVIALAAIAQVITACFQVCIYRKQSRLMAKSLVATKRAADAALLNAKVLITAERPLLLVSPGDRGFPPSALTLVAENFGKSPAEILFTQFNHLMLPLGGEPEFKNPPWVNDRVLAHRDWITSGADPFEIGIIHFSTLGQAVPNLEIEQKSFWLFGLIRYRGPLRNEIYESRFCYQWTFAGGYVMGGPAGYNDCT